MAAERARRGSLRAFLRRWPEGVVRYPWLVIAFWVVVAVVVVPGARNIENRLEVAARMPSEQAQAVHDDLQRRFRSPFTDRVLLVVEGVPLPTTPEGREALETIVREIKKTPGVAGTLSSLDTRDAIFAGKQGGFLVIVGLDAKGRPVEDLLPGLRVTTQALTARLRPSFPKVWLGWTGEMPLNYDLRIASASDARSAELRVLPLTLVLLLLAFGGALAAVLPVGTGLLSIALALGVAAWLAQYFTISIFIQTIASMIGLGLGIDYALLTVSRFREAFATRGATAEAAEDAARHAGWTILLSAFPVSIGFAALLTIPLSEQSSVGLAGLLVTLFALLLSVTLLPSVLTLLGRRIDWLRVFRPSPTRAASGSAAWRRWGCRVTRWPVIALVVASAPLLLLTLQARRLTTATPLGDWLPKGSESVSAYHALAGMGRENLIHSLRIVLDFPPGVHIDSEEGWNAAVRLYQKLRSDRRFERVQCLPAIFDRPDGLRFLPLLSPAVRRTLEASDGSATLFESIPSESLSPRDQVNLARELRTWNAAAITELPGVRMRVGGRPAFDADYEDVVARHFRKVVVLVVGCTFLALFAGFRSLLVAVKAVILNLLSVGASFGALVLVFQEGWGVRWLGVDGPTGSVFPIIPVLVFCIVFGLSMDYEVILVARVAEARRSGLNESEAIAEGLARTATVITSAAAIMIAVFAAFTLGKFLPIKMLGFALSVAVLIDAVAVRMVIGPALLRLAGRWNWWPGGLR
ncbi:MAG TPA: MMPL family transporter [Thermoanaerobaculia bacterium]|nr:MMPL family transporter [Thermoanaerobaculia bacterium]